MASINYFIASCLERKSQNVLTIALNITLTSISDTTIRGMTVTDGEEKMVYGLQTSAQETVLTLRLDTPSIPSEMKT